MLVCASSTLTHAVTVCAVVVGKHCPVVTALKDFKVLKHNLACYSLNIFLARIAKGGLSKPNKLPLNPPLENTIVRTLCA